jgi:hypothetical protein
MMRYHLGSTSNTVCKQMWHRSTMVDHQELTFKMSKVVPKEVLTMLDRSDGHDMAIKIHTTPVWKPKKWLCIVKTSWDRGLSPVVSRQSFVVICNYRLFTKHLRNILCQLIGFALRGGDSPKFMALQNPTGRLRWLATRDPFLQTTRLIMNYKNQQGWEWPLQHALVTFELHGLPLFLSLLSPWYPQKRPLMTFAKVGVRVNEPNLHYLVAEVGASLFRCDVFFPSMAVNHP